MSMLQYVRFSISLILYGFLPTSMMNSTTPSEYMSMAGVCASCMMTSGDTNPGDPIAPACKGHLLHGSSQEGVLMLPKTHSVLRMTAPVQRQKYTGGRGLSQKTTVPGHQEGDHFKSCLTSQINHVNRQDTLSSKTEVCCVCQCLAPPKCNHTFQGLVLVVEG